MTIACGSFAPRPGEAPQVDVAPAPSSPTVVATPTTIVQAPTATSTPTTVAEPTQPGSTSEPPTPTASPTPPGDIVVGDKARVVARAGVNIRQEPSQTAGRDGFFAGGAVVQVIDGPVYAGDFIWWRVDDQHGKEGWIAGGNGEDLWLTGKIGKPRPVNRPVRRGDVVTVSVSPGKVLTVRFEPGKKGFVARRLRPATLLDIIDGPVLLDGMRWWKVRRSDGLTGWAAEGDSKNRWLTPME